MEKKTKLKSSTIEWRPTGDARRPLFPPSLLSEHNATILKRPKKRKKSVPFAAATPRSRAMPSAAALRSSARRPGTVSVPSRGTPTDSGPALAMLALLGREKGMRISHGKRDSARAKAREENEEGRGNSDGRAQTLQLFRRATHSPSSTKQTQKERREERASRVLLRQLEALGDLLRSLFSLLSPQLAFELKGAPPASFIWSSKAFPDWLEGHLKRKRQFFLLRWSSGDRERSRSARSLFA